MKVLMVCLGNICRSPLAEGILREKVHAFGLNWIVDSAGTNGIHCGEAPHPLSCKVALQNGINISMQRARKFTKQDMTDFDLILAMASDVLEDIKTISGSAFNPDKTFLFLNYLYPNQNKEVPDPWYGTEPGYHEVYHLIQEACNAMLDSLVPNQNKSLI